LDQKTGALRIQKVYANTPAAEGGLTPGLWVLQINGIPTQGKALADCARLAKGPVGTRVKLELVNPEQATTNTVELTRQRFVAGP
jgi:C-terminal processing protease CtpA/Prc